MEFKLNKIDTDIRKKMQEEIRDGKVHSGNKISIKKDIKEDDNKNEDKNKNKDNLVIKRFYTIDGIRYTKEKVQIKVEKAQSLGGENCKGINLNVKR